MSGVPLHKPPPWPSLYIAEDTEMGGAWACCAEQLDGTGHGLGSTFCLYTFMLMSKGWVFTAASSNSQGEKKKKEVLA